MKKNLSIFFKDYLFNYSFMWKFIHIIAIIFLVCFFCNKAFGGWVHFYEPVDIHVHYPEYDPNKQCGEFDLHLNDDQKSEDEDNKSEEE